jgi:N-acetyltransferase 10
VGQVSNNVNLRRYAIDDAAVDWKGAEGQVANIARGGGRVSTVVSVKSAAPSGQKRKADDGDAKEGKDKKATRRGGSKKAKR